MEKGKIHSSSIASALGEKASVPTIVRQDAMEAVKSIINNLDASGIKELVSGTEKDLNRIIDIMEEEAIAVLNSSARRERSGALIGMDRLSETIEETFKSRSLNYFIGEMLPEFQQAWHTLEWGNLSQIFNFLCILCARGHGKSYFFSMAYPIWQMYRYRASQVNGGLQPLDIRNAKEGLLVTNEYKLGLHLMDIVKKTIEGNDALREKLYPGSKIGWGAEQIDTKTGARFMVRSAGSKIRGLHPNYIILDDFLNESSLYSQEQRDKYKEIFNGSIKPALEPHGKFFVVGTPFFEKDLYNFLKESGIFKVFEYPAIYPDGSVLFPERWNYKSIMDQKKLVGSLVFSREFLVKPVSDASTIFPYPTLKNSIRGMDTVDLAYSRETYYRKFERIVVGCDFAISAAVGADYSVFIVLGVDELGIIHALQVWRKKGASYSEQVGALKKINQDFSPELFVVETNGMQQIFLEMLKDANLPVVGRNTTAKKKSLYDGVPAMAVLFETHMIKFPYGTPAAKNFTDMTFSELNSITFIQDKGKLESAGQHDDIPMALYQGIKGIKSNSDDLKML